MTAEATLFSGPGRLPALCRAFDWASSPLGPPDSWPPALQLSVRLVMVSGIPQIILWGRDLVQIYNDAYAELIQAKHPKALGRGNLEVWPEVAHINAPIFDRVFEGQTVTREDALYPLERSGTTEDVYLTISYSPIRHPDGSVGGVLATMVETTGNVRLREVQEERERLYRELQAQKERFATVFRKAPSYIATLRGPDHVFEMANPAYRELVGGRPIDGLPLARALPEVVDQGFVDILDRVYRTGEPFVGREIPVRVEREGGTRRLFLDFVYEPLRDAHGAVEGILVHGVDVTEMLEAREELKAQAERMARQASAAEEARMAAEAAQAESARAGAAKMDFVATISHELRTPLNAITGYADLLLLGIPEPISGPATERVRRIVTSAHHLRGLIDEVLTFARLEADEEQVARERLSLRKLVGEVRTLTFPLAQRKGLRLEVRIPRDLPDPWTDPGKLRQILVNLVGNAVKFTERGEVAIEAERVGPWVHVHVRDTGRGIAAEHLEQIFEPFWQLEAGTTRSAGGTGLGLGVSRRLARLLGGDIRVESTVGEGSAFTVALPIDGPAD